MPADPARVDLVALADTLEATMPRSGSGAYVQPTLAARRTFADAARLMAVAPESAGALVAPFDYDVRAVVDPASGLRFTMLRERAPVRRGWGTFALSTAPAAPGLDVHADHPIADARTVHASAQLVRATGARWWIVAGAHRNANPGEVSDMARSDSSVLQAVVEAVGAGARRAVSVHGFARGDHGLPIDTSDVVLSEGMAGTPTADALALRTSLRAAGVRTVLFGADGNTASLGATQNPQGRWANATLGRGRWLHVESARELRDDPAAVARLVEAIRGWAARP
ncbi:MAG: hypothetical protein ACXW61_15165 [Gemmatirosa sp.]